MALRSATAVAHPNIAFIKYWGDRDPELRLPANGSLSMNLAGMSTRTTVTWLEDEHGGPATDPVSLNGVPADPAASRRVTAFLDLVRRIAGIQSRAVVESTNDFPAGTGIASSASAFAALALAATRAAGIELEEAELSRLARRGSGSACRSVPAGFVEWSPGPEEADSYAFSIAPPEHWDLVDCIAILSNEHKATGSTQGHALAGTSPLQEARLEDTPRRLEACRKALLARDFQPFAEVVELDSDMMHAVMMTSRPPLFYWLPATLAVIRAVREARAGGLPVCYTIDAGPNVHVVSPSAEADYVKRLLKKLPGVHEVRSSGPGGPARLVKS